MVPVGVVAVARTTMGGLREMCKVWPTTGPNVCYVHREIGSTLARLREKKKGVCYHVQGQLQDSRCCLFFQHTPTAQDTVTSLSSPFPSSSQNHYHHCQLTLMSLALLASKYLFLAYFISVS